MRLTPAQCAVRLICGIDLPRFVPSKRSLSEKMREGRERLMSITRKDYGYDLAAWHNHLKESREGGYTYGRNIVLPKVMQAALASTEWRETAAQLIEKRPATNSENSSKL